MEQFKASEKDWPTVESLAETPGGIYARAIRELRDRVAELEAAPDRVLVQGGEYLRAGTPVYADPRNRLVSYSVGEARPLEECGKDHAVPSPAAAPAAPAAAVPSGDELLRIWNEAPGGTKEGLRVVWDHGYQQGLAAGRAEQQATTEPPTDPAMTALELPRDWYPDFADWLKRQMPEGTVIGDPWWWASCIADWLIAKATLGPEPNLHDIALDRVDSLGRSFHVLPEILDTLRRAIREPMVSQQAAAEPTPEPSPSPAAAEAGLVEEVLDAMGEGTEVEARKAICKVAARARAHDLNGMSPAAMTWEGVAQWLEQEANR
jgi:hypothetical protein